MSDASERLPQMIQSPPPIAFRVGDPISVPTHQDILTANPDHFVAKFTDIAANNLVCAQGLPRTDELDVPKMLALLDKMAAMTRVWTDKSWRMFDLKPAEFNNSRNVYRVLTMTHVLHKHFGIHYNPERLKPGVRAGGHEACAGIDEGDTGDAFIHGMLGPRKTGICGTLPILTVAVGRRLGYPLYLVRLPDHLLCRWHDEHERFNIENTGQGSCIHPDEYYHSWPTKRDEQEWRQVHDNGHKWLDSMPAQFEMARFISSRVITLRHYGRCRETLEWIDALERFHRLTYDEWRMDATARVCGNNLMSLWGARTNQPPNIVMSMPRGQIITSLSPLPSMLTFPKKAERRT